MYSNSSNSTFSIPLSTFAGSESREFGRLAYRSNFVGDESNIALRYLCDIDHIQPTDWPLVLFGVSGSGKTSLALTLVSKIAGHGLQRPSVFNAESFRRKFANALETDSINEFRSSIAESPVLFVDDIHRLKGYPSAEAELTLQINHLTESGTPMIFTISDLNVKSADISPRLFSRISAGLSLPVNLPGAEARKLLFTESARHANLSLDDDALDYLTATFNVTFPKIDSFFRLLEVWLKSNEQGRPDKITLLLIIEFVASLHGNSQENIDSIVGLVADEYKLKVSAIKSSSRKQTAVLARGVLIFLLRHLLNLSFANIGYVLGGRDHSTIMHGLDRIESSLNKDAELFKTVEKIKLAALESCFLKLGGECE